MLLTAEQEWGHFAGLMIEDDGLEAEAMAVGLTVTYFPVWGMQTFPNSFT